MDGRRGMDSMTEGQEEDGDSALGAREGGLVGSTSVTTATVVAMRLHDRRQPPTATALHPCHPSEPLQCHHSRTRDNSVRHCRLWTAATEDGLGGHATAQPHQATPARHMRDAAAAMSWPCVAHGALSPKVPLSQNTGWDIHVFMGVAVHVPIPACGL